MVDTRSYDGTTIHTAFNSRSKALYTLRVCWLLCLLYGHRATQASCTDDDPVANDIESIGC